MNKKFLKIFEDLKKSIEDTKNELVSHAKAVNDSVKNAVRTGIVTPIYSAKAKGQSLFKKGEIRRAEETFYALYGNGNVPKYLLELYVSDFNEFMSRVAKLKVTPEWRRKKRWLAKKFRWPNDGEVTGIMSSQYMVTIERDIAKGDSSPTAVPSAFPYIGYKFAGPGPATKYPFGADKNRPYFEALGTWIKGASKDELYRDSVPGSAESIFPYLSLTDRGANTIKGAVIRDIEEIYQNLDIGKKIVAQVIIR